MQATASAVAADFRAILEVLELQTVHFGAVSYRTIEVEAPGSVARATYYVREVEVSASPPNPFMKVAFGKERMMSKRRLMLNENHIEVVDPDTVLVDGKCGRVQYHASGHEPEWRQAGKVFFQYVDGNHLARRFSPGVHP